MTIASHALVIQLFIHRRPSLRSIRSRRRAASLLTAVAAAACFACSPSPPRDSLQLTIDRDAGLRQRLAAVERVALDDPRSFAALEDVLYSDSQPDELRLSILSLLLERDPDRFAATFTERSREIDRWPILIAALEGASPIGEAAGPGIIRSWARASTLYDDAARPERAALSAAFGGRPADEVLFERFTGLGGGALAEQVAAWTVLSRLHEASALRALLDAAPLTPGLVTELRAAAGVIDVLPRNREGVLWLLALRDRDGGAWWADAEARVARLTPQQREGIELRHLPALRCAGGDLLQLSKSDLSAGVSEKLAGRPAAARTDHSATALAGEGFADHREALPWGDVLVINLLLDAMNDASLATQWFAQADADYADRSTEHGGVLKLDEADRWMAQPFQPLLRAHDNAYYASPEHIAAMYHGLAHYHFHAQRHKAADVAGPGGGDLRFAERMRASCVVLTFLDRDTLNVDYYAAGGVVVDLGVIRRQTL